MFPRTPETTEPETIRFGYGDTSLGIIAAAESMCGVAALLIGDDRVRLRADQDDVFPHATLLLDQSGLARTIAKAVALVDAPHLGTDLTLDLRGSAVEVAVWRALQAIPTGETRSYGAIARNLPMAATAQDVGAACAANRVAVAVPCHRVVNLTARSPAIAGACSASAGSSTWKVSHDAGQCAQDDGRRRRHHGRRGSRACNPCGD